MDIVDIFKVSGAILVSVGGAVAVMFGLSSWLGRVWATRIMEKEKAEYSVELERIKNELQSSADKQWLVFSHYFEGQFKLYNDLWVSLSELQNEVELLWAEASNKNLKSFVSALSKAKQKIRNSALLIEPDHYKEIMGAIDGLENYQVGKEKLISARRNIENIAQREIEYIIKENMHSRLTIALVVDRMLEKMREQIGGTK